jgi:transcriptional regulator with XRE-family HTH domain
MIGAVSARCFGVLSDRRRSVHRMKDPLTSNDGSPQIGRRLRQFRLRRNLSIQTVADESELSKGFISQLERDLASPSVASLVRVCEVLGIEVGALFEPSTSNLIRSDERPRINFGGKGVEEWLLTPAAQRDFQAILSQIEPGGGSGDEPYVLSARSGWVYVLDGELQMTVDGEAFELEVGDALNFPPSSAHTWLNPSSSQVSRVLWLLAPPTSLGND